LRGGATAVTTAPGVAPVLLKNGIVPLATWPGSQSVRFLKSGPAVRFRFPVTGGRVALSPLEGTIGHHDGILFINVKTPAPLFRLDLSHARLAAGKHIVTARGIGLKLTSAAAKALNAELGTKLFSAGLKLGTAKTLLRF